MLPLAWEWEFDPSFDVSFLAVAQSLPKQARWAYWRENPAGASMGVTTVPEERLRQIIQGDALGTVSELQFRDLDHF